MIAQHRGSSLFDALKKIGLLFLGLSFLMCACAANGVADSQTDFNRNPNWKEQLRQIVLSEMQSKDIPSFAIIVADVDGIVANISEGSIEPEISKPVSSNTLFRTGSVGKTITDLAIMRAVEQNRLDIDVDIKVYLPEFRPHNPYPTPITLKHLMTHESGLIREPPVGNYFDRTSPSLTDTVLSLNKTTLLSEPGAKTKYSNAGLAVAGLVLEEVYGRPYQDVIKELVFDPSKMPAARVGYPNDQEDILARGQMWWPDGRTWEAPFFDLGMIPAGDFYVSTTDMAALIQTLLKPDGAIVSEKTLSSMWRPHENPKASNWHLDVGIGFSLNGKFLGEHKLARHGGAVYGFATELGVLPEEGLGVYAVASKDMSDTAQNIANWALEAALAERNGKPMPLFKPSEKLFTELPKRMTQCKSTPQGTEFDKYVGHYGEGHNPVTVCVRNNRLNVLIEWFFLDALSEPELGVFLFPSSSLYRFENLWFEFEDEQAKTIIIGHGENGVRFHRQG